MEEKCPNCHVVVRPTDYFCYNCGKNLKPAPPSLSAGSIAWLFIKSIIAPPFGIYWALKYLQYKNTNSKIIGVIAIILTLISLAITFVLLKNLMDNVNSQITKQLNFTNY